MRRSTQLLGTAVFAAAAFAAGLMVAGPSDSSTLTITEVAPIEGATEDTGPDAADGGQPSTSTPAPAETTTTTAAPAPVPQPYPTTAPTTVPEPNAVEHRELLTRAFVDALNAADLDQLLALTAADPRADAGQLEPLIDFAPFWFEYCFEVSGGVPKCNARSEGFGLTLGFTEDDSAIGAVDGAYNDGQ